MLTFVFLPLMQLTLNNHGQGQTEPPGCLALARWAGWSAGQVGRGPPRQMLKKGVE